MKTKIIFSVLVKNDIKEAHQWYKKINANLALGFLQDYKRKIESLSLNPLSLEIKYDTIRICFLDRFPYGIHYEFIESKNLVKVYAVLHTSRNPQKNKKD